MPEELKSAADKPVHGQAEYPLDTILTIPNLISLLRLMMVPVFWFFLLCDIAHHDVFAFAVFVLASTTDWIDGQIARKTNTVSKFGQQLDPFIDRLLIASGVIGIFIVGRLPLWIVLLLVLRDLVLAAGTLLVRRRTTDKMVPVIYLGKITTALLMSGFAMLLLNWPQLSGLHVFESSALPGFGAAPCSMGIWFVYAGLICSISSMVVYLFKMRTMLHKASADTGYIDRRE